MVRSYAVNRLAVASAFFLALALALFAAGPRPWVSGTAHAQVGQPGVHEEYQGNLLNVDLAGKTIKLDTKGTLYIATSQFSKIKEKFDSRLVREGRYVHVAVDAEYKVVGIEEKEAPTGASAQDTSEQQKAILALVNTLGKGDRILLDGQEVFFEKLLQNQVYYSVQLGGLLIPKSVKQIRTLKKAEGGSLTPIDPAERRLKRYSWYRINEEFLGFCIAGVYGESITLEIHPGGEPRQFAWAQIVKLEETVAPSIGSSAGPGPDGGPLPLDPDDIPVKLAPLDEQSQLDWTANEWRIPVTFRQRLEDKIIIGARVEATFKGGGYYVTPAKEPDLIRELGPGFKGTDEVRDLQGIRHHIRRDETGNLWVIAELNGAAIVQVSQPISSALFPGAEAKVELRVPIYYPVLEGSARLRFDKEKGVLPFSDERALPYLVKAYAEDASAEVKEKILDAFARSGNAKILPFLLYEVYIDGTTQGVPKVRLTIAKMREVSEEYLLTLMREEGYKKEFVVPSPGGGVERKKAPSVPENMLARIIELLELMQSERAVKDVLALVRDKSGVVRDAARSFFTSRGTSYMAPVVKRLQGKTLPDAKEVLREMGRREPGSIGVYMREVLKIDDPKLEEALQGLTADEITDKQVAYLVEKVKDMPLGDLDEEVERAKEVVRRLGLEKAQVEALRRELSVEYAKQAIGLGASHADKDARPAVLRLLQRAIVLDPQNKSARRELAAVYLEISGELLSGGKLRAAPSDASRALRPLKLGEGLTPVTLADGEEAPHEWRKAKGADGVEGWVHASLVQQGKTTIGVNQERRPTEHVLGFVRLSRAIAPDRNAEIEKAYADATALMGDEAAARGDWEAATDHYRTAAAISITHRPALTNAYLRSQPLIPGSIALAIAVLVGAALIRPKDARTLAPLQGGRKSAPKEPAATRKVPS